MKIWDSVYISMVSPTQKCPSNTGHPDARVLHGYCVSFGYFVSVVYFVGFELSRKKAEKN